MTARKASTVYLNEGEKVALSDLAKRRGFSQTSGVGQRYGLGNVSKMLQAVVAGNAKLIGGPACVLEWDRLGAALALAAASLTDPEDVRLISDLIGQLDVEQAAANALLTRLPVRAQA